MRKPLLTTIGSILLSLLSVQTAYGAGIFFAAEFKLHALDNAIVDVLGYNAAPVLYFKELATTTQGQLDTRKKYEEIGCHPFYVMKDGKAVETGYNCRSFFCVGYSKGPKVCRDWEGGAYAGVSEISRRITDVMNKVNRKTFASYPVSEQSVTMKQYIADLAPYKCEPLYLREFDVVIGQGFACEEVGSYPDYSNANVCVDDWQKSGGFVCTIPLREDELDIRARALGVKRSSSSQSSVSSGSSVSSVAASSASSSSSLKSSRQASLFPDVSNGKYGYTAIIDLANRGIIKGYADGTFKPGNSINRAEFLTILLGGLHRGQLLGEANCFPDVREEWYSASVCAAKRLGWVKGYEDGTFRPDQQIRREEAMKIVVASMTASLDSSAQLPVDVSPDTWYAPYVRKGMELRLILEPSFLPGVNATRADSSVWIYRALQAHQG